MKVLIIEDERLASQKLIRLLKDVDQTIEVVDVLKSVEQTINWIHENPVPELVFMDIQLEDGLCFEIFENSRIDAPVIFTTAYDEYALKAFKVNSVDYLLKPIVPVELKNAIEKYKNIHSVNTDKSMLMTFINQLLPQTKERFLIKIGEHYKSVSTSDIQCFYILERCTFISTNTGKSYPIDYPLDNIEQLVDSKTFFRVSRNFIININAIQDVIAYSSNRLKVVLLNRKEKEDIIVSRDRVVAFKNRMDR